MVVPVDGLIWGNALSPRPGKVLSKLAAVFSVFRVRVHKY
jgi:hypothetical protein